MKTGPRWKWLAKRKRWTTIEHFGWAGNLICHADHGDTRDYHEYGSWEACCIGEGLLMQEIIQEGMLDR